MGKTECQHYCEHCGDCLECYVDAECSQGSDHRKELTRIEEQMTLANEYSKTTDALRKERDEARREAEMLRSDIQAGEVECLMRYIGDYKHPWEKVNRD